MRREALRGRFRDHHATMLRLVHEHVVHLEASIEKLDVESDMAGCSTYASTT